MNAAAILAQSFDFGTVLTTEQLTNIINRSPQMVSHLEHLATEDIDKLSESETYVIPSKGDEFNDLDIREKLERARDHGMAVGFQQVLNGYCAFRKLPIDGLEHEMPVALLILGVEYDVAVNNTDGKNELVIGSPARADGSYARININYL
ncbi:MAG: hypothetical protein CL582_11350 [Alteromonadaceae bacterium]|nr:hypothetical protein [Alteromonadaceae bacterium]|tara:strand:- start:66068 stop:66517 length:450 start_codon:yes stop_codon:yes gene_type:complete